MEPDAKTSIYVSETKMKHSHVGNEWSKSKKMQRQQKLVEWEKFMNYNKGPPECESQVRA